MSIKVVPAAIVLGVALVGPAMAGRLLGFERNTIVVAPWSAYGVPAWYPPYPPYLTYAPGAYFRPPPLWSPPFYGTSPEYVPGANWRDNWYDATRTKVHGYTLR
jgi:hypothetical protein